MTAIWPPGTAQVAPDGERASLLGEFSCCACVQCRFLLALAGVALCLAGCGSPVRLDAVPSTLAGGVSFVRIDNARFDGDDGEALKEEIRRSLAREEHNGALRHPRAQPARLVGRARGRRVWEPGLLVGWSGHGGRPQFKIVTGTSTGALAAPFAFLGSEFDWALYKMYTRTEAVDIVTPSGSRPPPSTTTR